MVMFEGVEFRSRERRISKTKGTKIKPEALVAQRGDEKVWVRDNIKGGLMYTTDKGKRIAQERINYWLPAFDNMTSATRRETARAHLLAFAEANINEFLKTPHTTPHTTPRMTPESDTPSVYRTAGSDKELLGLYEKDHSVPDKVSATLIGEALGRVSNGGLSIPSSIVRESKRISLESGARPWNTTPYLDYIASLATNVATTNTATTESKKRKRTVTPPSSQPASYVQHFWDSLVAANLYPNMLDERKEYQAMIAKIFARNER